MMKYELIPNNGQKSFYGKAVIEVTENEETLYSYGTKICSKDNDGNIKRFWGGWSATTGKHIKAFCGLNKAQFTALQVQESDNGDTLTTTQSLQCMLSRRGHY